MLEVVALPIFTRVLVGAIIEVSFSEEAKGEAFGPGVSEIAVDKL